MSKKMCMDDNGNWFPFVPSKVVSTPVKSEEVKPSAIDSDIVDTVEEVDVSNVSVEDVVVSSDMTVKELKLIADARGIKYGKGVKKDALLELLNPIDL